MLFSTVLTWLLIAVAFVIALPSLWLLGQALWPQAMWRRRVAAQRGLWKTFLLGLIPVTGGIVLVSILAKLPQMGALAAVTGGVLMAWGFLGAGGIAALVGERLWGGAAPWRQMMRGGFVVIGCALLPVVGWVVLLALLAVIGWGINVRAWFVKMPPQPVEVETAPAAPASPPAIPEAAV